MTVSVPGALVYSYATSGSTGPYSYPVRFLEASELVVLLEDADGGQTTLTLTTDYTVSGADNPSGGSVTLVNAPAAGTTIRIYRNTARKQIVDLADNARNPAEAVERQLDRMTMAAQDMGAQFGRTMKYRVGSSPVADFPAPEADKIIGYDANGVPTNKVVRDLGALEVIDDPTFATATDGNVNSAEATKAYIDTKVAIVADRAALKLVDTTKITIAVVQDGARSGVYLWDGTVPIATHQKWTGAGYTERQYVAPNAAADGAWVLLSGLNSGADSHQFYGNRLDLTENNDATAITPALFLRKNSTAGVNGMGLAKIQWRGTDAAGNPDIDAGRFDAVMTNADENDFTARMTVSPHVKGNDENIAVMSWDDGVLVGSGSSVHALTSISGGSGYAPGDRVALVSAISGQLGVAEVVTAPAGVIASVLFRNRGYGYADAETVTFSAITGTGTGGSATVVRGRSAFPQGFGTVNVSRGYYIGDSPVLLLSPDASFVRAAFEYLTLRDGVNALFNYGNGIANLATALYIRNLDTLRVSSGGTQVNRSRIIGKRVITYTSDTTLGALYNVVFVNATSGNVTLTLPAANTWGANVSPDIMIRRIDASGNTVTVQRGGSDTLNGGTSETIAAGIARRYNTNGVTAWYSNGLAA
jgi:hypothetical protein